MREFLVIFIVLVLFLWKPQYLRSFDTLSGRILMLLVVVFLARFNVLLGFLAALVMMRVMHRETNPLLWKPSMDLVDLEKLLRPRESISFPTFRTHGTPTNEIFEKYTVYR